MLKNIFLIVFAFFTVLNINFAQEIDLISIKAQIVEKKAILAEKQTQINVLNGEIEGLQKIVDLNKGWKFNTGGLLGFSLSGFNNWNKQALPNSKISNITGLFKANAVLDKEKFFWRNEANINLGWQQLVSDTNIANDEEKDYINVADVFTVTSLYGYKIKKNIAISGLGQYSSSIINNFNNPGILDMGVGATWTPHKVSNFIFTVHPINYHIVFQDGENKTQSALGTKIFISYFTNLIGGIKWSTDLNGFFEYAKSETSLNEYTWNNNLSLPAWHGIGIGIGFGIRSASIESSELQSYYSIGLSYNL